MFFTFGSRENMINSLMDFGIDPGRPSCHIPADRGEAGADPPPVRFDDNYP
jgi:hypothetical protein